MDSSSLEKSHVPTISEFPNESPIAKSMVEFGEIVAKQGRPPNNIAGVVAATGEIPMIKVFETPWNSQDTRAYGEVQLGTIIEGKFQEGFEQEWIYIRKGGVETGPGPRSSPEITATLRRKPTAEEKEARQLHHTDFSITLHKSGSIHIRVDSEKFPEVARIAEMVKGVGNEYSYSGKLITLPPDLEKVVTKGLTTILGLSVHPALEKPKN